MPHAAVEQWLAALQSQRRYAANTINSYRRDLDSLQRCYPDIALDTLGEAHIRHAVARLHAQGLKPRSLARALAAWRGFFQWWAPQIGLERNPVQGVRAPKIPRSLPKALSVEHAQALLDHPSVPLSNSPIDLRDQAMFEILYASGLRLAELVSLDQRYTHTPHYTSRSWIQLDEGETIVQGKGGKTRSVPLGRQAIHAIEAWLSVRDQFATKAVDEDAQAALFLGERGARIAPRVVQVQLNKFAARAGLPHHVHPHSLRHSFASHLLQSAQDLRAVQELLGHANITTTQIYTRLDFQHLAGSYDKAHPRAHRKTSDK
ncbi:tyrosine recombinase XerC [Alcaligenaceae bacterium CGII-47]|nr:tyrosine recombinase XerC [Alcaligenaceae bacterium CGII-47]